MRVQNNLRLMASSVAVMVVAVLAVRLAVYGVERSAFDPWGNLRVVELQRALPDIAAGDDRVLFLGSSRVERGFKPAAFDQVYGEGSAPVRSYNLGVGAFGNHPDALVYLARRIREAFQGEGRRARLALIEFVPFQLTATYRSESAESAELLRANLLRPRELAQAAWRSPEVGARLFSSRYVFGGASGSALTAFLGGKVLQEPDGWPGQRLPKSKWLERFEAWVKPIEEREGEQFRRFFGWSEKSRGFEELPEAEALELNRINRDPEQLEADFQGRVQFCDAVELQVDEALVDRFIELARELTAVSERAYLVRLPDHPKLTPSPEGAARREAALARIRRETGLPVLDFSTDPSFTPDAFNDTTHLTQQAADRFTRLLARQALREGSQPVSRAPEHPHPE